MIIHAYRSSCPFRNDGMTGGAKIAKVRDPPAERASFRPRSLTEAGRCLPLPNGRDDRGNRRKNSNRSCHRAGLKHKHDGRYTGAKSTGRPFPVSYFLSFRAGIFRIEECPAAFGAYASTTGVPERWHNSAHKNAIRPGKPLRLLEHRFGGSIPSREKTDCPYRCLIDESPTAFLTEFRGAEILQNAFSNFRYAQRYPFPLFPAIIRSCPFRTRSQQPSFGIHSLQRPGRTTFSP